MKPAILIRTIESRSTGSVSWIAADEAAGGLSKQNIPPCLVDPS